MTLRSGDGPYLRSFPITPDNGNSLPNVTSAIHCNSTGNANVIFLGSNNTPCLLSLTGGTVYPYRLTYVLSTGTTSSLIGLN